MRFAIWVMLPALAVSTLAGCGGKPAVRIWSSKVVTTVRNLGSGDHLEGTIDDGDWSRGVRFLRVDASIAPETLWNQDNGGGYSFERASIRLVSPNGPEMPPTVVESQSLSGAGMSGADVQHSRNGEDSRFNFYFAVGPDVYQRPDLSLKVGESPPVKLPTATKEGDMSAEAEQDAEKDSPKD